MQDPINKRDKILLPLLIAIVSPLIVSIPLYFLKFFGSSIQAQIIESIKIPENAELYTNILLVSTLCLLGLFAFIVSFLIWRKKDVKGNTEEQPEEKIEINNKDSLEDQFKQTIFLQILKLRGLNQIASPKNIATEIKQDPEIILAHLWKLHNEQYVTFQTGGLKPTTDTDFFLNPKAFEVINLSQPPKQPKPKKSVIRFRSNWVNGWRDR